MKLPVDRKGNTVSRGDTVRILDERDRKRWFEEEGMVLSFCGAGLTEYAVVSVGGQAPLFKLENVERIIEGR